MLHTTPWFRFPYPLQWGVPTFNWSSTLTMLAGAVSALVESVRRPASSPAHMEGDMPTWLCRAPDWWHAFAHQGCAAPLQGLCPYVT